MLASRVGNEPVATHQITNNNINNILSHRNQSSKKSSLCRSAFSVFTPTKHATEKDNTGCVKQLTVCISRQSTARIKHEGRKEEGEGDGECILASGGREVPVATHHTPQILVCPHHARDRATSYGKQQQFSRSSYFSVLANQTNNENGRQRTRKATHSHFDGRVIILDQY